MYEFVPELLFFIASFFDFPQSNLGRHHNPLVHIFEGLADHGISLFILFFGWIELLDLRFEVAKMREGVLEIIIHALLVFGVPFVHELLNVLLFVGSKWGQLYMDLPISSKSVDIEIIQKSNIYKGIYNGNPFTQIKTIIFIPIFIT